MDDHRLHRSRQHGRADGRQPRQGAATGDGFDLSPARVDAAAEKGVQKAANAAEAVKGAEIVITMLPAGKHVRDGLRERRAAPTSPRARC